MNRNCARTAGIHTGVNYVQKALSLARLSVLVIGGNLVGPSTYAQGQPAVVARVDGSALTNAAQILALSPREANAGLSIRIRGLVTYYEPGLGLFVQDETAGVFVYYTGSALKLEAGQYVEVTGVSNRGRYSPIIDGPKLRMLPEGPKLSPRSISLGQIYLGGLDAQWVRLSAVVREQKLVGSQLQLELAVAPRQIQAWVSVDETTKIPELVGSVVNLSGVVGTQSMEDGQLIGFRVYVNSPADLDIVQPAANRFPLLEVGDLNNPALRRDGVARIRVRGTVTVCLQQQVLYLQDSSGGMEIHSGAPLAAIAPGTQVEATGFLGPVLEGPVLEGAVVRTTGSAAQPQAIALTAEELLRGGHDRELVELDSRFLGWGKAAPGAIMLSLQGQGHLLTAILEQPDGPGGLSGLEPGSRVRLTGVCRARPGAGASGPEALLLLRGRQDIQVLAAPAARAGLGWEWSALAALLAGGLLVAALAYSQKQRRRTEHILQLQATLQNEMLQGEQQLRRSIEERDRIARDLHDDIIQSIYAVGLNLEDCRRVVRRSPEQAEQRVASAINALNNTIRNVRGFLAGLEPKVLNGREFKTALKSLALTSGEGHTSFQIEVNPAAANNLTSVQATQLLHIAKEAMSNSLRHAQAATVSVSLHPVSVGIRLEIQDNGTGFNPEAIAGLGHGLRNMTTRAREIAAELQIVSAPGQGCRILVTVPQRNPNESA